MKSIFLLSLMKDTIRALKSIHAKLLEGGSAIGDSLAVDTFGSIKTTVDRQLLCKL